MPEVLTEVGNRSLFYSLSGLLTKFSWVKFNNFVKVEADLYFCRQLQNEKYFKNKAKQNLIFIHFNNRFLRERGMTSTPKMEYKVSLHFTKELNYGYLRFEGNRKFGKVRKKVGPVGCLRLAKLN